MLTVSWHVDGIDNTTHSYQYLIPIVVGVPLSKVLTKHGKMATGNAISIPTLNPSQINELLVYFERCNLQKM